MANKYYYLISSLPYLSFDKEPRVTVEDFLSESAKWLSARDYSRLLLSGEADDFERAPSDTPGEKIWKDFNITLRKDIAGIREAKAVSAQHIPHSFFQEIFAEPTPLLSERMLEKTRWDFLEGIEVDYHFDITWLMLYYQKLKILKRLAMFNKEEGKKQFESLCEVHYD